MDTPWGGGRGLPLQQSGGGTDNTGVTAATVEEPTPVDIATVAAARSRAHGPTAALWHAVEVHRDPAEVDGACELTLCGSLARIDVEQSWPTPARDVCRACQAHAR